MLKSSEALDKIACVIVVVVAAAVVVYFIMFK